MIDYHPGKENAVADPLSRKSLFAFRAMNTQMTLYEDGSILAKLRARPTLLHQICEAQKCNEELQAKKVQCEATSEPDFQTDSEGCLRFRGRICIPKDTELIQNTYTRHIIVYVSSSRKYEDVQ
ncbi:uncharacterized protein LOC108485023 [Gossypium arboreum]|uniref:uncharacterized protein LOC108485023 n=1 Tax=Gossypium arboreum TaxID=29729 RepID=UPI0008190D6B|nr:uncharacterized protein LOC108485023 [Gossypium arboreum]